MPTVPQALADAAARFGGAEALVDGDTRLTWTQLHERVRVVAGAFAAAGVRSGDRVAVWAPNTHHWVQAALGAQYAGAVLAPINTRYTAHEALDILQRVDARALVVVGPFLGTDRLAALRSLDPLERLRVVVRIPLDGSPAPAGVTDWDDFGAAPLDAAVPSAGDVADVLFTSGTTGRSKGVLSAHRQVVDVATAWAECGEVGPADRYLIVNPFFHSFGYKAGIVVCLVTGATMLPMAVHDPAAAMALVERERVTVLPGAPTIFQTILDDPTRAGSDLSSLRFAVTGAAVVPVTLIERMQRELDIDIVLTAYGQTEAVVATMCRRGDPAELVARSCGRPVAGFEARIDPATGELLLRGRNVMLGYLDDAAATAAIDAAATAQAIDVDGWLHTGDVGVLDDAGYLTITDRLKDMYICGGFNVYPAEVEQALSALPGVADVAVVGVPDARLGEVGAAFVVGSVTGEQLAAFAKQRLANFKVPRHVRFVEQLPRNPSGKVLKTVLREEFVDV